MEAAARRRQTLWLAGISAVLLLSLLPYSSYVVAVPLIQEEWGLSNLQSGVLFSSYLVGLAVSALLIVPFSDRFPASVLLPLGVVGQTTAHLLFPLLADDLVTGCLLRFAAGAGHSLTYVLGIQLVSYQFAQSKRGAAVGLFVGAGYAGTTLSYSLMGLLLDWIGAWRDAYLGTALMGLMALLLVWRLPRMEETAPARAGRARLELEILRDGRLVVIILAYGLHAAELFLARLWYPLLLGVALVGSGRTPLEATALAGTWSGFMFMMGIAGVFSGGWISDRLGRYRGAALLFAISGLCSLVVGWLPGFAPVWLVGLGFVYGFTTAADSAIYATAVTELAPSERLGSAQAIQSFFGFIIGALMPVLAGSILDANQEAAAWGWAFTFSGGLAVVGVMGLVWLDKTAGMSERAAA